MKKIRIYHFWIFPDIIPQSPLHFFIPRVKIFLGQWENALFEYLTYIAYVNITESEIYG